MNEGKLVFITGASSGIGQALAARFHAAGYRLALVARRGEELARWAAETGIAAARVSIYAADVRDVDAIVEAGRACIAAQGVPDVVIANAGISVGIDTAERADLEVMRQVFETNVLGMAATFHPFVAAMRERRSGIFVGIASVAGIRGMPGHGAYSSSKAAVISYCESLRGELPALRRQGGHDRARLYRHAADPRQPLRHAFSHEPVRFRRAGRAGDRGWHQLARDSLADGCCRALAAHRSQRVVRPVVRRAPAQKTSGPMKKAVGSRRTAFSQEQKSWDQ